MNSQTVEWLLQGEAWIQYRTRVDLLGQDDADPQVRAARKAIAPFLILGVGSRRHRRRGHRAAQGAGDNAGRRGKGEDHAQEERHP